MCVHVIYLSNTGVDKSKFTVVCKTKSLFLCYYLLYYLLYMYYNCKHTLAHRCIYIYISLFTIVIVDRILELEPSKFQTQCLDLFYVCVHVHKCVLALLTQDICKIVSDLSGWGWGISDMGMSRERAGGLAVITDLGPSKLCQI